MFNSLVIISVLIVAVWGRNPLPDLTNRQFQVESRDVHNRYRATHRSPPLRIDGKIVRYAKSRCNLISQYESLSHGHAGLKGYGENLYWFGSSGPDSGRNAAKNAVKAWYDEVKNYDYGKPGFSSGTGHFTQVVWKSTTRIGCAVCGGKGSKWFETYVVCNYSPPGNYIGQFPQNVLSG